MRIFPLLLALFLAVPVAEIYLLIQVGSVIGAGWTIVAVVATAVLGATLVRAQGAATLARFQASAARNELPAMEIVEALVLLVAGALLLTPGFVTDAVGFACLVPGLRRGVIAAVVRRVLAARAGPAGETGPRTPLDGEYRRVDRS